MASRSEKRIKREPSSTTSTRSVYLNPEYKETHAKFYSDKQVISERFIDYESFPTYPISQCFSGKNMIDNLLHIRGPAPINPVRLFYSQIHVVSEEDQFFETYIEGKTHRITPDVIATLLGLERPPDPVPFPCTSEDELIVPKPEFRKAVFRNPNQNHNVGNRRTEMKVKHLKPIIHVLVKICQSNIIPRWSRHNQTNLDSLYLSFLILHGYRVDLAYIIWHTMANVGRNRGRSHSVPFGIIVGRLLSYLGHPFPVDTPCADVPTPLNSENLFRTRIPSDPPASPIISPAIGSKRRSKPRMTPISKMRLSSISPAPGSKQRSKPRTTTVAKLRSPSNSPSPGSKQRSKPRTKPVSKPQSPSNSPARDDDDINVLPISVDPPADSSTSFDQGHMSGSIQSIQHSMGIILYFFQQQREEFKQQREMMDRIARQQDRLAHQQDCLARRQARHHAMMMQYIQRASPDQASVCQKCGVTGFAELLIYCDFCGVSAEHRYCLDKIPKTDDTEVRWSCEKCTSTASHTSREVGAEKAKLTCKRRRQD